MYDDLECEEGRHSFVPCDCPECDKWDDPKDRVLICTECDLDS